MTARDFIKRHEGLRLSPYRCSRGYLTIGYGFNMDANRLADDIAAYLSEHGAITEEMAERLFEPKYQGSVAAATGIIGPQWMSLNEARRAALIAMVYQMGAAGFGKFKNTIALIRAGKHRRAALNMLKSAWENQTEDRAHETAIVYATGEWME